MHYCVLGAADILVYRQPAPHSFRAPGLLIVMWIGIAQEVPRRTDERIHRIRLACGRAATGRAGSMQKVWLIAQRRLAGGFKLDVFGQVDRQLLLRHRHHTILIAVDYRDRRAPVALAADQPVAQAIRHSSFADTLCFNVLNHCGFGPVARRASKGARIDHRAIRQLCPVPSCRVTWLLVVRTDDLDDWNAELACKLEVALIMGWYAHNCA